MKIKRILLILIGAMVIAACAPSAPLAAETAAESAPQTSTEQPQVEEIAVATSPAAEDVMTEVSFSTDVWPILEKYAVAAHGGKGGVFLENYSDILNNVVPGDPEGSLLYKALIGDGMKQMPPGNPLPAEMIQTIYDWIKQGAKDN